MAQEVVPCFPSKLQTPQRTQCLFFSQWQGLPSSVQHQQLQPDQRRGQAAGQSRPAFWPAGHHRPCRGTVHPSLPPVPPDTEDVRQGPRAGTEPRLPRDLDTESVASQTGAHGLGLRLFTSPWDGTGPTLLSWVCRLLSASADPGAAPCLCTPCLHSLGVLPGLSRFSAPSSGFTILGSFHVTKQERGVTRLSPSWAYSTLRPLRGSCTAERLF